MLRSVLFSFLVPVAVSQCLENGTVPSMRKNLVNPVNGESYPVGITIGNWAAGFATSYMAGILIQDLLGLNVTYTVAAGQVESYMSVAGCATPNNSSDRGCGPEGPSVSYQHLQMESWHSSYPAAWAETQKFATAPKLLGSMGYDGYEDMYFSSRELEAAYEAEGLALDFWTGFDSTWKEPWKYFDQPSAVNRSDLKPCSNTNLYNDLLMSAYLSASGDTAGVVVQPDGKVVANCPGDGYFWLSPSCRSDPTKCVLYLTGGGGYGLSEVLQKATKWNIPLAFGVALTWGDFTLLPTKHKSMFYWWVPDPTFLELAAVKTIFPPHNKQEWEDGIISSGALAAFIGKIVSNDLSTLAPRLVGFLDNIQLDLATVNAMLLEQKTSGEDWEPMMCRWLQNNDDVWSSWMPDDSTCFPKFGMYNEITEQFVSNRDDKEGLRCRACPSGTYSKQLFDNDGPTYICEACPAGTSQNSGASLACEPCLKGEYQDQTGQQSCKRCDVGDYQDEEGGPFAKSAQTTVAHFRGALCCSRTAVAKLVTSTLQMSPQVVIFSSISSMIIMALSALVHRAAMGGSSEYAAFNLGRTPNPDVLAQKMKEMAELLGQMETQEIEKAFDALAVFDTRRIMNFMTMMSSEVLVGRTDLAYGTRVSSASFQAKAAAQATKEEVKKPDATTV